MAELGEITVTGDLELQRRLDDLKDNQTRRILNRGLRAGGAWVRQECAERAPVRPSLPSGTALPPGALKFDIILRTLYRGVPPNGAVVIIGPGKQTAYVARWVEFGHALVRGGRLFNFGKRGKGQVAGSVPGYPFLRPAWEATRDVALAIFGKSVVADLDKLQTPGGR